MISSWVGGDMAEGTVYQSESTWHCLLYEINQETDSLAWKQGWAIILKELHQPASHNSTTSQEPSIPAHDQ